MSESPKIGLVAGWGNFPVRVAESLGQQGYQVYCVAIRDHADERLHDVCHEVRFFGMGQMGSQARYLRRVGVSRATMAGKIFKTLLFKRLTWWRHLPDLTFWRFFYSSFVSGTSDCRDDTLLTTVTKLYAANGIDFAPATDFAPDLLVREGVLTARQPNRARRSDIEFGWNIARQMGGLDIGQTVVINNQTVIAVEAIEGTDECIARCGQLCPHGGFTVVKVAKPNQDMRFDVPTVGAKTIRSIHAAGGKWLAIEAAKTILLDADETIELANQLGVGIIAIDSPAMS